MSVLFKNQFGHEQEENSYQKRHQHVPRKIGQKDKRAREENLLVFGYACNVYCDDEKAVYFNEGRHLMPWMGDESLMIDRFDGRLLLEDISPYISKGSSDQDNTWQLSYEEQEMERLCDEERYQALENDNGKGSDDDYEEEEMKRFKAAIASEGGSYSAVGMTYNDQQYYPQYNYDSTQVHGDMNTQYYHAYTEEQSAAPLLQEQPVSVIPLLQQHHHQMQQQQQIQQQQQQQQQVQQPQQQEEEIEVFVPPKELDVPADMEVPDIAKLHTIIERTAFFIKDHGPQMEIVVKAKQSGNQQFDFLQFDHRLNPYYKLILKAVRSGSYEPAKPAAPPAEEEEEESDDSDEGMELHPLLTASLRNPITSKKKDIPPLEPPPLPPGWTAVNPDATTGTNSFASKADTFFADMNVMGQTMSYPPGYPGYPYTHPGIPPPPPPPPGVEPQTGNGNPLFPPMFYSNNPATSLAGPISSYPGTEMTTGPPIIPPPPDLKPICDKLAEYVARNGKQFEENIRAKNDPRFDFINETSDLYTYYQTRIREFELNPAESGNKSSDGAKSGILVPSSKPVSFQIKTKDNMRTVMEYQSSILYKTAKADESEEEGVDEDNTENQDDKDSSQNGEAEIPKPDPNVHGPKTEEDVVAEERATKLKQEKEKEVERLEEEAKSTTSSLRRQVQLERRRRAQLFINMLKKAKPGASEQTSENQADDSEPHGPS